MGPFLYLYSCGLHMGLYHKEVWMLLGLVQDSRSNKRGRFFYTGEPRFCAKRADEMQLGQ